MILARLSRAVREQNWFAVALEFVIVIAGVVIGFQIANWNAEQQQQIARDRYLAEIADDLRADIAEIETTIAAARIRAHAARYILSEIEDFDPDQFTAGTQMAQAQNGTLLTDVLVSIYQGPVEIGDPEDYVAAFTMLTLVIDSSQGTYQELQSTGNLGVLGDRDLIAALRRYYSVLESERDGDTINRSRFLELMNVMRDNGIAFHDPIPIGDLREAVAANPRLRAELQLTRGHGHWQIFRLSSFLATAIETLALVEQAGNE